LYLLESDTLKNKKKMEIIFSHRAYAVRIANVWNRLMIQLRGEVTSSP
jgi:hypothetical protein